VPAVTADTNIYISALNFGGLPRRFLDQAAAGDFRLDISDAILNETLRVLGDKFHWSRDALHSIEEDLRSYTHNVTPTVTLNIIEADPPDNRILECAAEARSDYIVSGDTRHLLPLGRYGGSVILTVAAFLKQLGGAPG
jgi:putative PIN family toxin of toxin-antitoxin system